VQPAMSNLASGALLLSLRPYREGDYVECGNGERGRVLEQGPFAVVLERADGVVVTVPNNATFANAIRNHSRMGRRRVETLFLVDHDVDLDLVRRAVVERLRTDAAVLSDPPPVVLVTAIEDGGLRMSARVWVRPDRYAESASRIAEDVLGILRVCGISIGKGS
jgi:small conductance mechanosensitive channel